MKKTIIWAVIGAVFILAFFMTDEFNFGGNKNNGNINPGGSSIGPFNKADLESAMRQIFSENPEILRDARWSKDFDYITFFESMDGFDVNDGTGTVLTGAAGTQITFTTTNVNNEFAELTKKPQQQGFMTFSQSSRFRTSFSIDSVANVSAWFVHGSLAGQAYGFKLVNSSLYGYVRNAAGTETTVLLQTVSASTNYNIEARYKPNQKVIFLVEAIEKGTITTNLPTDATTVNANLMDLKLQTNTTAVKTMVMSFFQYQSARNILNF